LGGVLASLIWVVSYLLINVDLPTYQLLLLVYLVKLAGTRACLSWCGWIYALLARVVVLGRFHLDNNLARKTWDWNLL
jgi:hypothetical protein